MYKRIIDRVKPFVPAWLAKLVRQTRGMIITSPNFEHDHAQEYELNYAREWAKNNLARIQIQFLNAKERGGFWAGPPDAEGHDIPGEFFQNDLQTWEQFANNVKDKTCLEIGSGPVGYLLQWFWVKRRIVIDPLIFGYRDLAKEMNAPELFDPEVVLYNQVAEEMISTLDQSIDGCIICRNTLDHCEDAYRILDNISRYAKPGCRLLLWTDLYHNFGHDEGHHNITKDPKQFEDEIVKRGFRIDYVLPNLRSDGSTINYGCIATKI